MPPLVRAGLAAAVLATLAVTTDRPPRVVRSGEGAGAPAAVPLSGGAPAPPGSSGRAELPSLCPRGTIPDGEVCVPVPPRDKAQRGGEPAAGRARSEHDRIERRPDRPADFTSYRLPVELAAGAAPDGTLVPAARGAAVRLVRLEHQEGEVEVLHAGELEGVSGRSVVTLHAVRDAGGLREYVAIFAGLGHVEPGVARGKTLRDGEKLGSVGDAVAPESPALDYEIRRLRAGVAARSLAPTDFVADARTVGCDARNVLPLR